MPASFRNSDAPKNGSHWIWLALVIVIFAIVASAMDPALGWTWHGPFGASATLALLNVLPFLLIVALLTALTRRVILASWIGFLLLVASYAANSIKLQQLEMPLLPGDFHFLEELGSALPLFVHYIGTSWLPLLAVLVVIAVTIALFRETPWSAMRGWTRVVVASATVVLGIGMVQGWTPWRT